MGLSSATIWWVAAGIAVVAELETGTFYLLMMALGLASGAIAAHLGLSESAQVVCAAIVGGGATAIWHWQRSRLPKKLPAHEDRSVNLDIGERVHVVEWAVDRTARVTYRGSGWPARLAPGAVAGPGEHEIVAVEGNWLVLAPRAHRN